MERSIHEDKPAVFRFDGTGADLARSRRRWESAGFISRVVRGEAMGTLDDVYDEFATAIPFPDYFGRNRDAFDECITDLDELSISVGFVLVFTEPHLALRDDDREFAWLVEAVTRPAWVWTDPAAVSAEEDRSDKSYCVVLAGDGEQLNRASARWKSAGCDVVGIEDSPLP